MTVLRLGLIGDNIRASSAPRLHRLAGAQFGLDVDYPLLIPAEQGMDFDALFDSCRERRGLNITYPYKERVVSRLRIDDPLVAAMGAVNTVVFEDGMARGHNTDYSGFVRAYRETLGDRPPGGVALVGAGGVGKAIAFGLLDLGVTAIRLADPDQDRARDLAGRLRRARADLDVTVAIRADAIVAGADGVINATPLGMEGRPGTAIPAGLLPGRGWAFDAVYTPVQTEFLQAARAAGLATLSGWELFFYQGVDAFRHFARREPDEAGLRAALLNSHSAE